MWTHFSKVWSLQPAALLPDNSFLKNKLLYRCCSIFFSDFLETRILQNVTRWLLPIHVNYEIRKTSRKPSNNKSSLPVKKVFLKILQNSQEIYTPARVSFLVKLQSKKAKFSSKEFCSKSLNTINLADCLILKHSMFLFGIKQRTPHALLMLQTLSSLPL